MELEEILTKAAVVGVDFKKLRVVHVDDEPYELEQAENALKGIVESYRGFTDPREALPYIIQHSEEVDFLILDQFLTHNLKRLEGYQGTDLLRKLKDSHMVIPAVIFSGEHAKSDCFSLIEALSQAEDIEKFRANVQITRQGNYVPLAYVAKERGIYPVLLNMAGLIAMKRNFIDEDYDSFFIAMRSDSFSGMYFDLVKLGYEKAMTLYSKAGQFARDFAENHNGADLVDPTSGRRFSEEMLEKCGFKSGIALKPEEIMQLSDRTAFLHEFSRSARSVLLSGLESAIYGDCVNLLTRYILSLEKVQGISFRKQPLLKYLETETEIKGAVASIIEFMGANLILGTELSEIYHMLACEPLWGIPIVGLDCASPFPVNYHLEGNIVGVKVISDNVGFRYIVSEVFCNAQKVGDRRGIEAKIDCDVSEIGYDGLPESARDFYDRNPLSKRNIILIGALLDSPKHLRYIKVSIRDNCGGFKGDVEGHFRKNVSGTGSTGQGLAMLRNSQERLLYSLEVLNTPGEGAMFNFYFVKG